MATVAQPCDNNNLNINNLTAGIKGVSIHSKMKQKEDEINKLFDASKRKLASLDSQRILSVLDESIRKIEIVTLLPYLVENLSRYSIMLGSDLCIALQEYDKLQSSYTKALSNLRKSRPKSTKKSKHNHTSYLLSSQNSFDSDNDIHYDEDQQEEEETSESILQRAENTFNMLGQLLSDSVKTILRLFKQNPSAISSCKLDRRERASEANKMMDEISEFREQIFCRLVTSPSEDFEKHKLTVQMMQKEKKAQSLIKKLEVELKTTKKTKEELIFEKNEVIRRLKADIQMIEQETDLHNRKMISDAQKAELAELKNSDGKKSKLQQEIIQMKQKMQSLISNHKDNEMSLRKRKYKIETEVENWIQKYDNDMKEKQDDIDELTEIYNEEKKQLEDLEERFKELEKQYEIIIEERRIAQEKREAAEAQLRVMVKAATLVQSFWRAYRCRKALKAKQKRGKKGKGKGKKKR